FAGELPGAKSGEQRFGVPRWPERLDLAARHNEEWHRPLSHLDEHLTRGHRAPFSMTRDTRDLRRRQRRKDTIRMRDGGRAGIMHGPSECSQACEEDLLDQGIGEVLGR